MVRVGGRRTVIALWAVAALLAAGLVAFALVPRASARGDVTHYIERVNAKGQTFARDYRTVSSAYRAFTLGPGRGVRQLPRLRAAARELTRLRLEVQGISAPPAARRLRARLIALYRRQEAVGYELVAISAYVPRLRAAELPLGRAAARMRSALAGAHTPETQAAALGRYAAAVAGVVQAVRGIQPLPLFAAAHRAQLASLERSRRSISALRRALLTHDRERVTAAVAGIRGAGGATSGASRAAVAAYNRHVTEISRLGRLVERERLRLNRTLG